MMKVRNKIVNKIMTLPMEQWKDIKGHEGRYQISNYGRVKSINKYHNKTIILTPITLENGYVAVNLSNEGKRYTQYVHRLVGQSFIENPNDYKEINHIDEDKTNNTVWNLEFCDRQYNINYGTGNERRSATKKATTQRKQDEMIRDYTVIAMIDPNTNKVIQLFKNSVEANEYLGKDKYSSMIRQTLNGRWEKAYGYKWKKWTFKYSKK